MKVCNLTQKHPYLQKIAILLIDRCNNKSEENRKKTEEERSHTDNQVRAVIAGFGKEISKVIADVNRNTSDQAQRMADLELNPIKPGGGGGFRPPWV